MLVPPGRSTKGYIRLNTRSPMWPTLAFSKMTAASYPADALFLFVHGTPNSSVRGGGGGLLVMRDFFSAILAHVEKEIAAGSDKAGGVGMENFPGFPDFHVPLPNRLRLGLGARSEEHTSELQSLRH